MYMYDFVFFVIYNQQIKKGKGAGFARYNGSLIASLTLLIHIMLLFSIFKFICFSWYKTHSGVLNKGFISFFVVILMILGFFYYNENRTEKISHKFARDANPTRVGNYIKV